MVMMMMMMMIIIFLPHSKEHALVFKVTSVMYDVTMETQHC
jgi:hypothetical protein